MSETDNIFDIDYFLKEKKAPKSIKQAWEKHLQYFNQCEDAAIKGQELIKVLNDFRRLILGGK